MLHSYIFGLMQMIYHFCVVQRHTAATAMVLRAVALVVAVFVGVVTAELPNAIYNAQGSARSKLRSVKNGVMYNISAPNNTHILEMHIYGTAYQRGVAHGSLLSAEIPEFMTKVLARVRHITSLY